MTNQYNKTDFRDFHIIARVSEKWIFHKENIHVHLFMTCLKLLFEMHENNNGKDVWYDSDSDDESIEEIDDEILNSDLSEYFCKLSLKINKINPFSLVKLHTAFHLL